MPNAFLKSVFSWFSLLPLLSLLAPGNIFVSLPSWAHTLLVAKRIEEQSELCRGPEAKGEVGHFLLMNAEIKAVISSPDYAYAFSSSGGNILDLARTADNEDGFTHFYTLLNTYWPNQANYTKVEVLQDGHDGQTATIRAIGFDVSDPDIKVMTDYSLRPHDRFVTITTTIIHQKTGAIRDYAVGDAVQWGVTDNFGPGAGYELLNVQKRFPWVATQGKTISYGYATEADDFDSMNHSTWTDSYVRNITLTPNTPYVFKRFLSVGTGSVTSAVEVLLTIKRTPMGTIEGFLREEGTSNPIPEATILLANDTASPFLTTISNHSGHFLARVPAGRYEVSAIVPDRTAPARKLIQVRAQQTSSLDFGFGPRGLVRFEVRDAETNEFLPAKIIVTGLDGQTPYFGNPDNASGALNTIFTATGTGTFACPPGKYRMAVAHGLAYSVAWSEVDVSGRREALMKVKLHRDVSMPGWLPADFHVHAAPSDDSSVTLRDRVTSLVAEGIEIVASTDHNILTDYGPVVREMKLESKLFSIVGDELTTVKWGHFNAFPLKYYPERRWGGAPSVLDKTPEQIFAETRAQDGGSEKIIQVNHPRWPYQKHAYFDSVQLNAADLEGSKSRGFSLNFDAVEIMNGLWNGENYFAAELIVKDWFGLLNQGHQFTAVGNSDSHTVVMQEVGYPRNYVFLGKETTVAKLNSQRAAGEKAVIAAIKNHRVVVSNGPFVWFTVGKDSMIGDTISLPNTEGPVKLQIHIHWPAWMGPMDKLQIFANGKEVEAKSIVEAKSPASFSFDFAPPNDTWIVVAVRGSRPLDPVLPTLKGRANTPFAMTNPIWVDRDGNGQFDIRMADSD